MAVPLVSASSQPRLPEPDGRAVAAGVRAGVGGRSPRWRVEGLSLARGDGVRRPSGVTYGPFPPNSAGEPFPEPARVVLDFEAMGRAGIDAIRTYCPVPPWLLGLAEDHGISVLCDVPWAKHLCFLDSARARREARDAVRGVARAGSGYGSVLAYSIANEIPADVVRWHGVDRVEAFLGELVDVARQADPAALVTYANFPPTEYLRAPAIDFVTFNVYLHDLETFRRYVIRLQNLAGELPLVLGELGIDSIRHGEEGQAKFVGGHLAEAALLGVAGAFVFSWTDLWYTGGHLIEDWAFGVTRADRTPKPAVEAIRRVSAAGVGGLLSGHPRVSVVVCSYNGARTLEACLESLSHLDYPDYEVILVDDGSTDGTQAIAARFPGVRSIRHEVNRGLSASRNTGMHAATGEIVAYTDSDCVAVAGWLTHLVHRLQSSGAEAVGGPNLSPEDGWLAACINASPGQPTHVLESDQVAEHVPGCNMAFRRTALEAINGFDDQFRRAGDDVDVCWRLQQTGGWITFAPGAMVWHHRRQTPRAYFRQQAGYGEAEALLRFKHPEKFNGSGRWKWRGVLYGASLRGLHLRESLIYRGMFGTGFFQCLYQPQASHWAMLPSSLEWHLAAGFLALNSFVWRPAGAAAIVMFALSAVVACLLALQAKVAGGHDGPVARVTVAWLSYAQPLVRSAAHYLARLSAYRAISAHPTEHLGRHLWECFRSTDISEWWGERGGERTELVTRAVESLRRDRFGVTLDTGWSDWDVEVFGHAWTRLRMVSVQEEHGSGRRLHRLRSSLRLTWISWAALLCAATTIVLVAAWNLAAAGALLAAVGATALFLRVRGVRLSSQILDAFDESARALGFVPCRRGEEERP